MAMTENPPGVHSPDDGSAQPLGLEELYRRHVGFVWRCLRRFGTPEEALEDVVHDVFLTVRDALPQRERRAATTANARRRSERAARRNANAPAPVAVLDPEEAAARVEAEILVTEFLAQLDPDQAAVFELCDIEGLSGPDAAALLGINLNVAYSRLRLARRRLEAFVDARATGGRR
jgi:RNA polymerase sigma-70 factor, ECF subfamily